MSGYPDERFGEPPVPPVSEETIRAARRKVALPATFLILNGVLGVVLYSAMAGVLLQNPLLPVELLRKMNADQPDEQKKKDAEQKLQEEEDRIKADPDGVKQNILLRTAFVCATNGLAILGAVLLRTRDSRGWGYASSILSTVPLITGCCCTGLPFGVWGLFVLGLPDVAAGLDAARRRAAAPNPDGY
jgi:hypothetical protein